MSQTFFSPLYSSFYYTVSEIRRGCWYCMHSPNKLFLAWYLQICFKFTELIQCKIMSCHRAVTSYSLL